MSNHQRNGNGVAKRQDAELSEYVFGKVQPQALPLEEAVLGALMLDKDALPLVLDILRPESFYSDAHQLIYRAIMSLFEKSLPIDLLTVTEELRNEGNLENSGGAFHLVELTNRVASSANIEFHAQIISQKAIRRELIKASNSIIRDSYEETVDTFDLIEKSERDIFDITQSGYVRYGKEISTLASNFANDVHSASQKPDGLTGIPSGYTALDRITGGWQDTDLVIIAARPGMGKTSFALSVALNAAKNFGKPVAIFSLEMSDKQLVGRLVSQDAEIEGSKLRKGELQPSEWQKLQTSCELISGIPLYIDDTPSINIFELRAKCRRLKLRKDISMVVVDYIQLMSGGMDGSRNSNREQEISTISRSLKGLAKELNVPVIALSQLSRAVETRGGSKRPQLSDLRESGAIEQDADIVTFIYRPEYYNIVEDENGQSVRGVAELIIAKHRNGPLDTVQLRFVDKFTKFSDLDNFGSNQFPAIITNGPNHSEDEDLPF